MKLSRSRVASILFAVLFVAAAANSQTSEFTFQGRLDVAGQPANTNHDFEVRLYTAVAAGNLLGSATRLNVPVANGVFSVMLSFPPGSFDGGARFVEVHVRAAGGGAYQPLSPRQQITSVPYAIRSQDSANAFQLGGVSASGYVLVTDPRMTDPRQPVAGSGDYVQNRNTQQASSSFNISGNGTVGGTASANIVNATSQYNIDGNRVFSIPGTENTFVGRSAGIVNSTGLFNSFFGSLSGESNTTGRNNTIVGAWAGRENTTGSSNAFFGSNAGNFNTSGGNNAFFGAGAGFENTTGADNAFFGSDAGIRNTTGNSNAFFGSEAGYNNTTGGGNAFFGNGAGRSNTTGMTNSFFGGAAGESNTTGQNNAFFGLNAGAANTVSLGNSFFGANAGASNLVNANSFFGASSGFTNTTGINNSFFGAVSGFANTTGASNSFFGHWAGHDNTTGNSNSAFGAFAGEATTTGDFNVFVGRSAGEFNLSGNGNSFVGYQSGTANASGSNNTLLGSNTDVLAGGLNFATAIGAGATVQTSNTIALGRADGSDRVLVRGLLVLTGPGAAGASPLCLNASSQVGFCASSLRYKADVTDFRRGLDVVRRLRPIAFNWRTDGTADLGFGAEELWAVEPRLVQHGPDGRIEGVRYGQITTVLVNAVKEQQEQITRQEREIEDLRRRVEMLSKVICAQNPSAEACKPR